jgi:calcineurin-like phosphoesterase
MNVLFVGDVVGPDASAWLASRMPELRHEHAIDLAIVNAENCRVGGPPPDAVSGMTWQDIEGVFAAGVDVITSGNHSWDGPDADRVLAHERVLRPMNVPADWAGKGFLTLEVNGEPVTVVNLTDTSAIPEATPIFAAWDVIPKQGAVIIDMHSSADAKFGLAHALDGEIAALIGTHTHEATLHLHLLPGGTALVVDVGMTGPTGGHIGFSVADAIAMVRGEPKIPAALTLAPGPLTLGAVVLRVEQGKTVEIRRIH